MTREEKTAVAIVRAGRSFDEAAFVTGVTVERVMQLWSER